MKPTEPDRFSTLDLDLAEVTGGQSTFTNDQLMQWCQQGREALPQNPDLGCVRNVTGKVGDQVSQDNLNQFKAALSGAFNPTK